MKPSFARLGSCSLDLVAGTLLCLTVCATAGVMNGNFGAGLDGWTRTMQGWSWSVGGQATNCPLTPVQTASLTPLSYQTQTNGSPYAVVSALESHAPGAVTVDGVSYTFEPTYGKAVLSQLLFLEAGNVLMGEARYSAPVETPPHEDPSWVSVQGASIDQQLWHMDVPTVWTQYPTSHTSDWQSWQWTAPASAWYTLSLVQMGDDQLPSYGYFRNISVVPEPSIYALVLLGAASLWRKK